MINPGRLHFGSFLRLVLLLLSLLVLTVPAGAEKERILATVNGAPVTFSDYRKFLLKTGPSVKADRVDKRSGGIQGRPILLYMLSNILVMRFKTASACSLIARIG
jgi:hypothetical protein